MQMMERTNNQDSDDTRDTLMMLSGAALVIFGTGLILTTPMVRRLLGGFGIGNILQAAAPDFERYLKLKAM